MTGAASGIGHETALAFARHGAHVVALDLDARRLETTSQLVEALGRRCLIFGCDVSDAAAVDRCAARVLAEVGPPHVVVNNAGIGFIGQFLETPLSTWSQVIGVNLMGIVHIIRAFLPAMLAAGEVRRLINVASAAGLHSLPNLSAYSASKHAVLGLSDSLAMELAGTSITVTTICPGIINTPIVRNQRAVAASVPAAALDKLDQQYQSRGIHPSVVGERIVRAAKHGEDIVLVGPTAAAVFHARRLSRRLLRKASIAGARRLGYLW